MAKAVKKVETVASINVALLGAIAAGTVTHISKDDGLPLLQHNPQLIEVNTTMLNDKGDAAVRLTPAGQAMVAPVADTAAPSDAPKGFAYELISGAALPASKRGSGLKGSGAPIKYPFEKMEIGGSFFVPVSEKLPDPVKTLGSTVSSANMRYAEDTGEKRTVTRTKRGEKNKALIGPDGKKVTETVEVPVYRYTRRFSMRPVEAGVKYGEWTAPANGVLIMRVPLKDAE